MLGLGRFSSISFGPCKCLVHSERWLLLFCETIFLQKHIWQQSQHRGEKKAPTEGCSLSLERAAALEWNLTSHESCVLLQVCPNVRERDSLQRVNRANGKCNSPGQHVSLVGRGKDSTSVTPKTQPAAFLGKDKRQNKPVKKKPHTEFLFLSRN